MLRRVLRAAPLVIALSTTGCCLIPQGLKTESNLPVVNMPSGPTAEEPEYPIFPKQAYEEFMCDNGLMAAASQAYRGAQVEYSC